MVRLITRVAAMALSILVTYIGIWSLPVRSDLVYASLLDKHTLLSTVAAPRVIFIGGSGIALGLDSELIERELGLPVINMGVNAGFGLHYMLEEVQPYLQRDDLVVIVPEYEHFYGRLWEGDQNLLWALRIQPNTIRQITWQQFLQALPAFPLFIQQRIHEFAQRTPDPIYNRAAFNEHGDFVNHLTLPTEEVQPYAIVAQETTNQRQTNQAAINRTALTQLADFQQYATAQGATVVLLYPAIADTFWHYANNQMTINQLHDSIAEEQIIQELSLPDEYVLPTSLFFDTVYHLSGEGRLLRSERVAAMLNRTLIGDDQPEISQPEIR